MTMSRIRAIQMTRPTAMAAADIRVIVGFLALLGEVDFRRSAWPSLPAPPQVLFQTSSPPMVYFKMRTSSLPEPRLDIEPVM